MPGMPQSPGQNMLAPPPPKERKPEDDGARRGLRTKKLMVMPDAAPGENILIPIDVWTGAPLPTLAEVPLDLVPQMSKPKYEWTTILRDDARRSYMHHLKNVFTPQQTQRWFDKAKACAKWERPTKPNGEQMPRSAAWYTKDIDVPYKYSQMTFPAQELKISF